MVLLHCYLGLAECWKNGAGLAAADVLAERCWLEERCHFDVGHLVKIDC